MSSSGEDAFGRALAALRAGQADEAERSFKNLLSAQPRHVAGLNLLGILLIQLGRFAEAEQYLKRASKENATSDVTFYNYGVCLKALNRPSEALERFGQALAINPNVADTWNYRGSVLNELGRHQEAIADFDRAIAVDPKHPAVFCNRGNALFELGSYDRALESFASALALRPDLVEAWLGRGNAFLRLKRYDDALAAHERAAALKPDLAEAWLGLGNVFAEQRRHGEALDAFEKALAHKPDLATAWHGRGNVLSQQQRHDDALRAYEKALSLKPDLAEAWLARGNVFFICKRFEDALEAYQKALAIKPDFAGALLRRGNAFYRLNLIYEAMAEYRKALAVKSDYAEARFALCFAELPIVYSDEGEIALRRNAYEKELVALCDEVKAGIVRGSLPKAIENFQPFYLAYQGENDRDLQRRYGAMVCRIMEREYPDTALTGPPAPDEPVRIGIVSGFFWRHSNWKIPIKGWVSQLDRKRFKVFGYHVGRERDAETEIARGMFDRFVDRNLTVDEWRREILADAPHVLIYPGLLMEGLSVQLAAQRLAPVQCNSWGHPETSGMPTLDYFLSSDLMEPPDAAGHYTERLIRLPNLSIYYEPVAVDAVTMTRAEIGLRPEAVVFWCGQSLYKYLPQFDDVFARIAKVAGDSQFVFLLQRGAVPINELFRTRLDRAFAAAGLKASNHCVLLPPLDPSRFVAAIGQCDIFLDSIGWSGCNSTLESLAHDLPIVTTPGVLMRGRHSMAVLQMMGLTETIAGTVDQYVAIAARLAQRPDERQALRRRIAENKHRLYRDGACIVALENFLDQAGRRAGR